MKECPFRIRNDYGQYICSISVFHIRKTKTCQQISDDLCKKMRDKELGNIKPTN